MLLTLRLDRESNLLYTIFGLVSAHENLHETDPRFEVRLTNDWFVFVFVVELAWSEKTTQFLTLSLLTLSSFAAEIIFSCYKVWLDLNFSFHRTKVGLKGYPIPIPQHLIKILASPLRKKNMACIRIRICTYMHRSHMWTAAALKAESWHAPEYEKPEKRVNWRNISTTEYCWFARDVIAFILAVCLGISLIWKLNLIFM